MLWPRSTYSTSATLNSIQQIDDAAPQGTLLFAERHCLCKPIHTPMQESNENISLCVV
jgi:hypothetical protein